MVKISTLKDLNKVLLFVKSLSENSYPSRNTILHAVSTIGFGDKKGHNDTLDFLVKYDFLLVNGGKHTITKRASGFLKLNAMSYVEILDNQKRYLLNIFLHEDEVKDNLYKLFNKYDIANASTKVFIDPNDSNLTPQQIELLNLFKWLNFFETVNGLYSAKKTSFHSILKTVKKLQLDELLDIIKAQQIYGKKAEELAAIFEKNRLNNIGHKLQAELVKIVAETNVLLGYDLLSFNGANTSLEHDRFIEVKCSVGNKIRFFWTINELKTAKKLRSNYWIYFFPNIMKKGVITPIMVNDPATVFTEPKYKIMPTEFVVEEY